MRQINMAKPASLAANCKRAKSTDCSMLFGGDDSTKSRSTSLLPKGTKPTMAKRSASTAAGEVIGKTETPWGVSLRRRSTVTPDASPKRRGVSGSNSFIRKRRSTLRATPLPVVGKQKSLPKKTSSRKFKLKTTPFTMGNAPIFGIVLKPCPPSKKDAIKPAEGEEDFMDLQFNGSSTKADTKPKMDQEEQTNSNLGTPFGIRLKPVRRGIKDGNTNKCRTFQIDLKPPSPNSKDTMMGKYIPESKSFLEIRLKPVKSRHNSNKSTTSTSSVPEFVELQLRHVVAPVDGGPKRAVTQASFQIPVSALKHVDLDALRRQRSMDSTSYPNLAELLQLQIESLNHLDDPMKFKGGKRFGPNTNTHSLRINLRHVDPNTGKVTWLPQSIQVELQDQEYETTQLKSASNKRSSMHLPPSMQVSLRPVVKDNNVKLNKDGEEEVEHEGEDDACSVAKKHGINRHNKIRLKSAVQVVHEEEEEWDEEEITDDCYTDEELSDYDEHTVNSEDKKEDDTTSYFQYEEIIEDTLVRPPTGVNLTPSKNRSSLPDMNLSRGMRSSITDCIPAEIVTEFELEEQELLDAENKKEEEGDEYDEEEVLEDEYDEQVLEDEYEEHEIKENQPPKDEYEEHVLEEDEYEEHEVVDKENDDAQEDSEPQKEEEDEEEEEEAYPAVGKMSLNDEKEDTTDSESVDASQQEELESEEGSSGGSQHDITARVIFRADTRPIDTRPPPRRRVPRRTRSRSLTEIDRVRQRQEKRREDYIERKRKEAEEAAQKELTMDKRRDLLMWYNRMKCPTKEVMKRRVAKLPPDCDITPEDVELLPWLMKGRFLDLKVMNQFFMEDWQGSKTTTTRRSQNW